MTMYAGIIACATAVAVLGILVSAPLVVITGTLCACATLLFALLRYFEEVES